MKTMTPRKYKKGLLEELQSLDESTKKKIMIVASAMVMIVVVYFWLAYFNTIVANVAQPQPAVADSAVHEGGQTNLLATMYEGAMNILHKLGNIFEAPRQYIVHPPK
jgi:hypothetical protein